MARATANKFGDVSPHPNEVDRKRIERLLSRRSRYRYVSPEVSQVDGGYWIKSPCCSRNIDSAGGVIDIALLEYEQAQGIWRLHRRDHANRRWLLYGEFRTLAEALQQLNLDPERMFWQ